MQANLAGLTGAVLGMRVVAHYPHHLTLPQSFLEDRLDSDNALFSLTKPSQRWLKNAKVASNINQLLIQKHCWWLSAALQGRKIPEQSLTGILRRKS